MDKVQHRSAMDNPARKSTLKQVFDLYADETISDEQTNRLLASVFSKLEESSVERSKRNDRPHQITFDEVLECSYA